jgi:hypothetical protein
MKLLLDTNIWRYLSDFGLVGELLKIARSGDHEIQISPAVLYETLRIPDPTLRSKLVRLMVRPEFYRLMPEAYSESMEILSEIKALRPNWLRSSPDLTFFNRLVSDWRRRTGGFWHRCAKSPSSESQFVRQLGDQTLNDGRKLYDELRQDMRESEWSSIPPLNSMLGELYRPVPGWKQDPLHPWRLEAWQYFSISLPHVGNAYRDWIGPSIDFDNGLLNRAEWVEFWFYQIREDKAPRQWLRWAHSFCQRFRKVTPGSVGDNQIFTYLLDADYVLTGDKGLLSILEYTRPFFPQSLAVGVLYEPKRGRDALLEAITNPDSCIQC